MKTLVWVEHDNAALKDATLAASPPLRSLAKCTALVAGHRACKGVAEAAAKIAGVAKVHVADDAAYANRWPKTSRRWWPT
jgi:electron transfer flavoprotein alpha subunit